MESYVDVSSVVAELDKREYWRSAIVDGPEAAMAAADDAGTDEDED